MNRASILTAGILLSLFSVSLACLPTPGVPSLLLNKGLSLTEGSWSSKEETDAEKPTGLSYKSFTFPSNCPPACVKIFLKHHNYTGSIQHTQRMTRRWAYQTNITKENQKKVAEEMLLAANWKAKNQEFAKKQSATGLTKSEARQLRIIETTVAKTKEEMSKFSKSEGQMSYIYARATVVRKNKQPLEGQSDVEKFFRENRDYDALKEVWTLWRDKAGRPLRPLFQEMVKIQTAVAKRNNYSDHGRMLYMTGFDDPRFNEKVMDMFADILPFYKELHAYVRFKLAAKYPKRFDPKGPIPAHIFGNTWAQSWQNIFDLVVPYPKAQSTDVTAEMRRQNWTVMRMFKTAEDFFVSLGLPKMTPKFWKNSMLKKPKGRRANCHGSAWDFSTGDDYRIKMCTEVTQEHLATVHHEMGHISYYMLYSHLPIIFRRGANSGFHEAVGDTIGLSVNSVKHFATLGFVKSSTLTKEAEINALMRMALTRVAFLPYALAMDAWRWRIYNGTIKASEYNRGWWQLRRDLQGLEPPVARTEEDFDAGAKFHTANNVPYIRYFISSFLQFEFYEAMCKASGHQGPLYTCDFYQSKAAGDLMRSALSLGLSKPWQEAMRRMTGQPEITTGAIKRYFAPLLVWLKTYRKTHKYPIGW